MPWTLPHAVLSDIAPDEQIYTLSPVLISEMASASALPGSASGGSVEKDLRVEDNPENVEIVSTS